MSFKSQPFAKFATYMVLVIGLSASAFASCGDVLSAMAAGRAGVAIPTQAPQPNVQDSDAKGTRPSIVGLWHVLFTADGQTIQEAYQVWNQGGTEVHNPNIDPRTGSVCLGAWKNASHGTYKLAHRVWSYDSNGNFLGTINLSETLTVSADGRSDSGTFALKFYDPTGKFLQEVDGNVAADRISVE
jgi:hypothetical protein